ncbi:DUF4159 domain-containing protein [Lujinxingia vulgaris]|uniref:DUF4159 domain-containing protein n=2 Tax=Lujinxingia vulgaris TaxID=2600176 RepID=A0A5C6X9B1_9DELT|nr:DUF4159 domain-containing protein [Lujinxingia vulgaris]
MDGRPPPEMVVHVPKLGAHLAQNRAVQTLYFAAMTSLDNAYHVTVSEGNARARLRRCPRQTQRSRKPSSGNDRMNRRTFLQLLGATGLSLMISPAALALDDQHRVGLARLRYQGGNDNPRPGALRRMLQEVGRHTSVEVNPEVAAIWGEREELFLHPMIVLAGDRAFEPLPEEVIENLRLYLSSGGFLYIDSAEGLTDGPFMASVRRELQRVFPDRPLRTVPREHTVHKSFYLIDRPMGRLDIAGNFEGIFDEERACVLVNPNDLLGALARDAFGGWEHQVSPGGDRQRDMAQRLAVNIVLYALTIDYKADQVHIPFILRRRRWRVD